MHYFFCEDIPPTNETCRIAGPDARHIKNVLRLKAGDTIGLFDGKGMEYVAAIEAVIPQAIQLRLISRQPSRTESPVALTIAQAFLKDRKMDRIVRQLTELGVCEWLPFFSHRSVPRPNQQKLAARSERWKRITRQAIKQCRRGRVMDIQPAVTFDDMLTRAQACDLRLIFWENEPLGLPPGAGRQKDKAGDRIFAAIGPEGGFTTAEIEAALAAGFITAGLGPRILRADTAAVAAATLLQFVYGDLGEKDLDKTSVIE
jgi:16S rRNA (uracil1498-N3)-methyltransferase